MPTIDDLPERFHDAARWLQEFARDTPGVLACYVGGSLVNDRVDDDSDLDATIVTTGDAKEPVFEQLLGRLDADFEVEHRWVLPTPTWHGGLQLFAHLRRSSDAGDLLIIDLVVDSAQPQWLSVDPRRHGRPLVLHDPGDQVSVRPDDDAVLRAEAAESADRIAARLPVAEWLVAKAVRRGHWPEAYAGYLRLGIDPLVQLLRTEHSPARWDFGLRYLDDLPTDVADRVVALLPAGQGRLAEQVAECFAWQRELLDRRRN